MNLITAIVMASGFSKRMGLNKLLMKYNDKFLIEHTLEKISQCDFAEKIIVTQYEEIEKLTDNFKVVINENAHKGQSESIKLGVKSSERCDGYMFFVADQPLINQKDIEKLIRVFRENKDFIVIPKYKEKRGNPVIYPSLYKEEILRLEGDKGGKSIIKSSNKIKYVEVEEDTLFDIDNKDDFNKLLMRKGDNE
ncbi:molybdenum cofactor cytidylyltransferase [Terrisporobacter sp.]|uniref:molybdenum cofactor cytidylyltransferase n=1 Tax=Terrisporobacter sp. TaxID=1965305 RepID=UPI002A83417C|nr:molybdenum cofactor cytidylyltransferase [Terrisporobacter sp.]MDY4736959.1 molybdenum cofactor cytidylyltransferase [Terrisporobacter sp.]